MTRGCRGKRVLASQSEAHVCRHKISPVHCTGHPTENRGCVLVPRTQIVLDDGTASNYILRRQKRDDKHSNKKEGNFEKEIDDKNARDFHHFLTILLPFS